MAGLEENMLPDEHGGAMPDDEAIAAQMAAWERVRVIPQNMTRLEPGIDEQGWHSDESSASHGSQDESQSSDDVI